MRRPYPPFDGKRYILNKNTAEVHDLDRETPNCRINDINTEHIKSYDSFEEAEIYSIMLISKMCNGCAYCMPERNKD